MKRDLIEHLQSDRNLYAEYSCCASFPLKKALMFYVDCPITDKLVKLVAEEDANR